MGSPAPARPASVWIGLRAWCGRLRAVTVHVATSVAITSRSSRPDRPRVAPRCCARAGFVLRAVDAVTPLQPAVAAAWSSSTIRATCRGERRDRRRLRLGTSRVAARQSVGRARLPSELDARASTRRRACRSPASLGGTRRVGGLPTSDLAAASSAAVRSSGTSAATLPVHRPPPSRRTRVSLGRRCPRTSAPRAVGLAPAARPWRRRATTTRSRDVLDPPLTEGRRHVVP